MSSENRLQARLVRKPSRRWTNKHDNFTVSIAGFVDIWNPVVSERDRLNGLQATVRGLQELIRDAVGEHIRLRALGSGWSISKIAVTDGWLINTKPLNWIFSLSQSSISPAYAGDTSNLYFVQCGVSIGALNRFLRQRGKALKSSGASNGQTIAGALSTGTHGSAIDAGSIQDFVVGLHIVVAPDRHVYLERDSRPVTSDAFAGRLNAEVIRDDDFFNAALISFGSFGIIHGVMIEVEDLYLLEAHRIRVPFDHNLDAVVKSLDFDRIALPRPEMRPYHFEIVVNPHTIDGNAFVTVMYRLPYRDGYERSEPRTGRFRPGDDFLGVVGELSDLLPGTIPGAVNAMTAAFYRDYSGRVGTLGEIFPATGIRGRATGAAMGVPLAMAGDALDAVLHVHSRRGPFPGVFALRYISRSEALLAMTRSDVTCIVDLDGADSRMTRQFFRNVWDEYDRQNIPCTFHWGKVNELDAAAVRRIYGSDVQKWLNSRRSLLTPEGRHVFSSRLLDQYGLSD